MERAVDLASVGGLEGLSIGALAADTDRSKGGVVALFGTKEQLQLATVEAAREIFIERVIAPALAVQGGRARLDALLGGWLDYSESRVFAGGCFFAAAAMELGSRPGPVRDAVAAAMADWHETVRHVIQRAMDAGELTSTTDAAQLAFEVTAILDGANSASRLTDSAAPYARARVALGRLL
jgi:AcrR family transcriptional regulator